MELHAPEIVRTVRAIRDHLGAKRAVIALKKHYEGAVAALSAAVKGTKVELYLSDSFYPAGDEQNLVFSITGKTVPTGGIPLDVGCVVSNVSTVLNIAHAMEGMPVTDKLVTVGGAVARPVTVSAPIGTPLSKLLDAAGGAIGDCTFIVGGPLCGVLTSMVPVIMMTCSQIQAAAETGLFPAVDAKKNKHGISPVVLVFVMLFAIVITSTGATFGVLMTLFSFANCLGDIVLRIAYLKRQGRDLMAELKAPYTHFEEREAECAAMDAGK